LHYAALGILTELSPSSESFFAKLDFNVDNRILNQVQDGEAGVEARPDWEKWI
jgi:hypothetical protein